MRMRIRRVIILIFWVALLLPAPASLAATATYTYDSLNRVIQETYANGLVIDYTYDAVGNRLTSHSHMLSFQITVDTTPSGLQITADGVTYPAPHIFTWEAQSTHTLTVPSPQSGSPGVQYVFNTWSDGGAQSHAITTPAANTTYTATLLTQNLLTMSLTTAGSGTITPTPAGTVTTCAQYLCEWYTSGASVTLTPTPASGNFLYSWSGDCTSAGACVVTMDAPRSVTATFLPILFLSQLPTSKINLNSSWTPTGCNNSMAYQCVDDPIGSPNNGTDYIRDNNSSGREATFGFPAFTVPAGSAIAYVRVTAVEIANSGSNTTIQAALRVGSGGQNGSLYTATAQTLSQTWATYFTDWTTNPQTGAAWTVADVNGTGSNPLRGMGVYSGSGDESVTQVYVTVAYVVPPDTTVPANTTGAEFINGGAISTVAAVTLAIAGTDAFGVTGYYASESATTPTAGAAGWVAVTSTTSYAATVNFTLSAGDGTKTVYVWLKDGPVGAGNVSVSVSDTIILDTVAPVNTTGANFISGGAASTPTTAVTLAIAATDSVGVTGYYASESATTPTAGAAGWVVVISTTSYAANVAFTLSAGNGLKTVYVWFKDAAGNVSSTGVSDTITLSGTATTQDRLPTSNLTIQSPWSHTGCGGATTYQCVDDPIGSPNNSTDYIRDNNSSGKEATFGFLPVFTVPAGSAIVYVRVTYVAIANTISATNIKAALRVGGTTYTPATAQTLSTIWAPPYSYDWTTNPRTGAAWIVEDVNGTGSNPLQGMGVVSGTGDESVTQVYVTVGYQ